MATAYTIVYDSFVRKIKDYQLTALYQSSPTDFNTYLSGFLIDAIQDFVNSCRQDLTDRDDGTLTFNIDLEDVNWDEATKTLSGISRLVKNDDYERIVTLPEDLDFIKTEVSEGNVISSAYLGDPDVDRYNTVKVQLKSQENQKVNWSLSYK